MALNELMHDLPDVVPLIPGSGVQFLDLGFSISRQSGVPTDWEYYDPLTRTRSDRAPSCTRRGEEVLNPISSDQTYTVDVKSIIEMFDRVWVPIPMLRRQSNGFYRGPTNWTRAFLARLPHPDERGNDYRLVIAADTSLLDFIENEAYLAPSPDDARNGREFKLAGPQDGIDWYITEPWVRDWCFELYRDMLEREERRRRRHNFRPFSDDEVLDRMQGDSEPLARYRSFLDLILSLDIVPSLRLVDRVTEPRPEPIDVDLVLDLGNSRSCGLLIESDPTEAKVDITKAVRLQLRDLTDAEQTYADPFPSRFEFARARFGKDHISLRSGRSAAFAWPTIVRVGVEASRLLSRRSGTEGTSGLSSPKRYLWDEDAQRDSWRVSARTVGAGESPFATDVAFTTFVNDLGEPLHKISPQTLQTQPDRGILAIRALYSRRNLASFALAEIFVHAMAMMNSPLHRLRRPVNAELPRRLRRIILTIPTAISAAERKILEEQANAARDLAYLSLGLAETLWRDDGMPYLIFSRDARVKADRPETGPEVLLQWDEATATQAVYLYTQVAQNYSGGAHAFFESARRPEINRDAATQNRLRLATIDVGGGTTDLMITSVVASGSGNNVTLEPTQEFREGFNFAGDDALLRVVREHVLIPIRQSLWDAGLGDRAENLLNQLLGGDHGEKQAVEYVRRQQFAAQIAAPIALAMLRDYEGYDPLGPRVSIRREFESFFAPDDRPSQELIDHFNAAAAKAGALEFRLEKTTFEVAPHAIDLTLRSTFLELARALTEVVHRYRCDLLILSGRTSNLPALRALMEESGILPAHRIVSLHQFRVGPWYPFRDDRSTVGDPKTTAAVGAMICLLGNGQLQNFNFRSDRFRPRSTARYFGKLSQDGRLLKADEFYDNLDLDRVDYQLPDPEERTFEFRGPMPLGFRQMPVEWWPGSRLYYIDYRTPDEARALNPLTPLRVALKRINRRAERLADGTEYIENPELAIASVTDREGRTQSTQRLRLRLQTLDQPQGYWLDTGILLGA
jgi:hypothetical protein